MTTYLQGMTIALVLLFMCWSLCRHYFRSMGLSRGRVAPFGRVAWRGARGAVTGLVRLGTWAIWGNRRRRRLRAFPQARTTSIRRR